MELSINFYGIEHVFIVDNERNFPCTLSNIEIVSISMYLIKYRNRIDFGLLFIGTMCILQEYSIDTYK